MLTRMRQQQDEPKPVVTPMKSANQNDDSSTIQNVFNIKTSVEQNVNASDHHDHQQIDLYRPLSYDEADENQLVDIFTTIDIEVSFGEYENVIKNLSEIPLDTERQSAKRRRLSNSGDSYSTAFTDETKDYDGTELPRKREDAPVE